MKLPRPYVPLRVRRLVAERQYQRRFGNLKTALKLYARLGIKSDRDILEVLLNELFGRMPPGRIIVKPMEGRPKLELHHRPALCNRIKVKLNIHGSVCDYGYTPDANDPDYLVYLPADEHDVETRVRGQHGDYSDLAKARKRKRIERKQRMASRVLGTAVIGRRAPAKQATPRHRWPKRKFPKRRKR